ncbi:hypothetical protein BurJ1DRAFT_3802 [Burkholderiales bacterium JOSHI_001]|nr:hypothetical protein BurJ1DRAFT_3802 [Burkholderiales bacterium JOSHI_001]
MNGKVQAKFDKSAPAGKAVQSCPAVPARSLNVSWGADEVYCADLAPLNGTATGIASEVTASASMVAKGKQVDSATTKGQSTFKVDWKAQNVNFEKAGASMPDKLAVVGKLAADGMDATTPKALAVKRLPDKAAEAVSFACSSPKATNGTADYGWTAAFRLGVKDATIKLQQTLQIKKAWLGKWVLLDEKKDKVKQAFGFVKKSGTDWKYWNDEKSAWKALPRDVSAYTVNNLVFVESGKKFVSRDDGGSFTWPESFQQPKNYEDMKKKWRKNIQDTWGEKFSVKHKDCNGTGLCAWDLSVNVDWSAGAGDKLVYAVWSADWERSNATDWYLSETRLGVAAHECGHLLGAFDEYTGGAIDPATSKIEADSIMGQNLTSGKARHLDAMRDELKKKVKSWIGRDWPLVVKGR